MSTVAAPLETLRNAIAHPTNGILGIVDELLQTCADNHIDVDWTLSRCRLRINGLWEELDETAIRKSIFRAILARIAAICNDQSRADVSPYGGQGLLLAGNPPTNVRFSLANTTDIGRIG